MANQPDQFRKQVLEKIDKLLTEFGEGKVSREQFHAIYEHYNNRLNLIDQMGGSEATPAGEIEQGGTIAIRQKHMGKALGLIIYHHKSAMFVDTLGDFDVAPSLLSPTLNDFSLLADSGQLIDRRILKLSDQRWLLFAAGRYSTVATLFHHEPSALQVREIERLHHDFETANASALRHNHAVNKSNLAYPFLVFVQSKLKKGEQGA